MELDSILPVLQKIPLFADLKEDEHQEITNRIILNYFPARHVFFKEGDPNDSLYIIKRGIVKITRKDPVDAKEREVATLNDLTFFGEMGLVLKEPRNATATAITDCEIFELKKEDFDKLMVTLPSLANKISDEFVARVKQNNRSIRL